MKRASRKVCAFLALVCTSSLTLARGGELISVGMGGAPANLVSEAGSLSANGRFVAFSSAASNLVPGDTNGWGDVFVRDRYLGTTELVSIGFGGAQADNFSHMPRISADGRFVVFTSYATNLVANDTNGCRDIFVRDRVLGTTELVSVASGGAQGNSHSSGSSISADGRFVCFDSQATNFVTGDTNGYSDCFLRDRQNGTTELVSVGLGGAPANLGGAAGSISSDGRFVAFESQASDLVVGDVNASIDVFLRDRLLGTTELVSMDTSGAEGNSLSGAAALSVDGRFVVFASFATNLVAGDTNASEDLFVRDRLHGTTERVSVDSFGTQGNHHSHSPSFSADARFLAFCSQATNFYTLDGNSSEDVFVRDLVGGTTRCVSVNAAGHVGNAGSHLPSISADGRFVLFQSQASDLVLADTNGYEDVFVSDPELLSPGADVCQAGGAGVMACPCSNPPADAPRGCDNSSSTGGAQLISLGSSVLASDSVLFVTHDERPNATSIVLQGNAELPSGVAFGQGVRCVGGALKRLYTKVALGGSIAAPAAGEPSVSARSAALGDTITAGTSRWYAVYYRDPIVLGTCPAASTFNITQTQRVRWGS